jgi:hypothetical protein
VLVPFSVGLQNIVFKFVRSEDMIGRILVGIGIGIVGIGFEFNVLWVCCYYGIQTVR